MRAIVTRKTCPSNGLEVPKCQGPKGVEVLQTGVKLIDNGHRGDVCEEVIAVLDWPCQHVHVGEQRGKQQVS